MKRLLIIGFTGCAFALAPTMSASAMPVATPYTLGSPDGAVIQVKGGHGHGHGHGHGWGHHGGRGHHYGWHRGLTMVGIAATTMVGDIIAIGGEQRKREAALVGGLSY